ncbi:MAG: FAD-dependent oxidoreductase, partial [candidate division WOR-3 bacterium]
MISTDIAIAGAGPAGLTAGIYAARSGHRVLLIEKSFAGGQMALTAEVENYPGFSEPVSGLLLAQSMEQQAARFGCTTLNAEATSIRQLDSGFELTTTQEPVRSRAVIISTG